MEQYLREQIELYKKKHGLSNPQFSELIGMTPRNFRHYINTSSNWSISFISSLFEILKIKMVVSELDQETAQEIVNINQRMLNVIHKGE